MMGTGARPTPVPLPRRQDLAGVDVDLFVHRGAVLVEPALHSRWQADNRAHDVDAERWTVDGLDFLELSIRVTSGADDATAAQRTLEDEVAGRGLEFEDNDKPKTERVMRRLAGLD